VPLLIVTLPVNVLALLFRLTVPRPSIVRAEALERLSRMEPLKLVMVLDLEVTTTNSLLAPMVIAPVKVTVEPALVALSRPLVVKFPA